MASPRSSDRRAIKLEPSTKAPATSAVAVGPHSHHGSADQLPALYAAVGARVAVASAGRDNDYGHPSPRAFAVVEGTGDHERYDPRTRTLIAAPSTS